MWFLANWVTSLASAFFTLENKIVDERSNFRYWNIVQVGGWMVCKKVKGSIQKPISTPKTFSAKALAKEETVIIW